MFKIINKSTTTQHKHAGFTLAETLITLVVIGIVAAITVPTLINKHRKAEVETRLKATYSIFANAFKAAEADYGSIGTWDLNELHKNTTNPATVGSRFINRYMRPYLKVAKYRTATFQELGYKKISYPNGGEYRSATSSSTFITLTNGITFWIVVGGGVHNNQATVFYVLLDVDINGPRKGPNTVGKDIFMFYQAFVKGYPLSMYGEHPIITCTYWGNQTPEQIQNLINTNRCPFAVNRDTGLMTFTDFKNSREEILESCQSGSSWLCGALIRHDGWRIADDYPWL